MKITTFLGLVLLGGTLACSPSARNDNAEGGGKGKVEAAPLEVSTLPDPSNGTPGEVKTLVEGNNAFAFDLYSRLSKEKGNIIFSPYSISNALAMTYAGARGETEAEMAKVLHFDLGQERLHEAFGSLIGQLDKDNETRPYQLYVANSLWVQEKLPLKKEFLEINRKNYGAGLKEVDFARKPEEARLAINKWVENKTKEKIKDILHKGDVDYQTLLCLVNAIYFKANWQTQFPMKQTKNAPFEISADEKPLVPMMHHEVKPFRYYEDDSYQWLELPYKGKEMAMVILLPRHKDQLAELEEKLSAFDLRKGISQLSQRRGSVALPRFKMTLRLPLGNELDKLSMHHTFSGRGDFSGIAPGFNSLDIRVIHKAYIEVDEVGTEAAAATAVGIAARSRPPNPFSFQADHPFLFLIRNQTTDSILFLGRVSDPR